MLEVPTFKTRTLNHVDCKALNAIQVAANKNIEDRYYILQREVADTVRKNCYAFFI